MRKKRVLFVTEATYLNTGYSTYSKQILDRLFDSKKYEIAEFSIYGHSNDPRRSQIRWKSYSNMPDENKQDHVDIYNSTPANQFGAWRFERVCLDFEPDSVLSIRDYWMDSFIYHSPYRRIFKTAWMPTVDANPQDVEWVDIYSNMDYILTYSDWAGEVLKRQGGKSINLCGVASPCAPPAYTPMSKTLCRKELGIPEDANVIGTVMRNQRRKLFPVLVEAFGRYLKESKDKNAYLYLHTSYPDAGWNLAQLCHDSGVSSRVLMSYVCEKCKKLDVSHFNDSRKQCSGCGQFFSCPSSVSNGLDDSVLAKVYNCMDLYVQAANSEGYGCPVIEAASCGIPLAVTNYSAMEDFVDKLDAYPIELSDTYKELETGCERAVPSKESLVNIFKDFFSKTPEERLELSLKTRRFYEENYSWDKSVKAWTDIIDDCSFADWKSESSIMPVADIPINQNSNNEFIEAVCSAYIPYEPHKSSYFMNSILRDLNRGMTRVNFDGFFGQENGPLSDGKNRSINREMIKAFLANRLKQHNLWESARLNRSMLKDHGEKWLS